MDYTLITGGAGYIGSHICLELYRKNTHIVVIDNLSKSKNTIWNTLRKICPKIELYEIDLINKECIQDIFKKYKITNVIHLAGFKSVNESIQKPLLYYRNNLISTINLLEVMEEYNCKNLIFSSSATVYGNQIDVPIKETASTYNMQTNPYGKSKLIIEMMLKDLFNNNWNIIILRYFNPVASDSSGLIGEDPKDEPCNLFPHIINVYLKKKSKLKIFGNDYKTKDGTCIRDFIHVSDLALAHIKSIDYLDNLNGKNCYEIFNIGTGKWYTIMEIVDRFNELTNNAIPFEFVSRREGDVPFCFADCSKASQFLNWKSKKTLDDIIKDSINRADILKKSD
jgi:UDP-glucose 4-epimerase